MSIKERPLLKAVDNLGALPGFLFDNPVFLGFMTLFMSAFFGAFTIVFAVTGHHGATAQYLFDAARNGAIIGITIGGLVQLVFAAANMGNADERPYWRKFLLGGVIGVILLVAVDFLLTDWIRVQLLDLPPIHQGIFRGP
ncbi:MAG: hypothetical protein AAFR21_18510 [Pseudomonadota bacterium]